MEDAFVGILRSSYLNTLTIPSESRYLKVLLKVAETWERPDKITKLTIVIGNTDTERVLVT